MLRWWLLAFFLFSDTCAWSSTTRRNFLASSAVTTSSFPYLASAEATTTSVTPIAVGNYTPAVESKLGKERISKIFVSPLPNTGGQELYYAPFLFGSWNVTATLRRKVFPFGKEVLPNTALLYGSPRYRKEKVGQTNRYQAHYFSTEPNLGLEQSKTRIIRDRRFNMLSISKSYDSGITSVDWNYRTAPTRLGLGFAAGPSSTTSSSRAEVFMVARAAEISDSRCAVAERTRSVTLLGGTTNPTIMDQEQITEFRKVASNTVEGVVRIAVYPTTSEAPVNGRAVALYDYEFRMERQNTEFQMGENEVRMRACVVTPNDVVQCV